MKDVDELYKTYQPFLISIAYRMLGSVSDAEDIVQDLFLHLKIDTDHITDLKAYLAKMTINRCLNFLKSARVRREIYTGPWLPEPQVSQKELPLEKVLENEIVSYAFLVLLEQLAPTERVVFVLREVLAYEYEDIAKMLEKNEPNTRKIFSRAKQKIKANTPIHSQDTEQVNLLARTFIEASATGDFQDFIDTLTEDVVLVTDGGGKVIAALNPIFSKARVTAFLSGVFDKGGFLGELLPITVNGQKGIVQLEEGRPVRIICFDLEPEDKSVRGIFIISNPDKLKHVIVLKEVQE